MSRVQARDENDALADVEIHEILSNERRLMVLEFLREDPEGELSLRELARRTAELETGESPPPRDARQSAYVSLHQSHLPKLDERNVVDYDIQSKTVALAEQSSAVSVYMETVPEYGISWSEYFTGLALLGLLLVLAVEIGVPGFAALGTTAAAAIGFLAIMAAGAYRTNQQGESVLHRHWLGNE